MFEFLVKMKLEVNVVHINATILISLPTEGTQQFYEMLEALQAGRKLKTILKLFQHFVMM